MPNAAQVSEWPTPAIRQKRSTGQQANDLEHGMRIGATRQVTALACRGGHIARLPRAHQAGMGGLDRGLLFCRAVSVWVSFIYVRAVHVRLGPVTSSTNSRSGGPGYTAVLNPEKRKAGGSILPLTTTLTSHNAWSMIAGPGCLGVVGLSSGPRIKRTVSGSAGTGEQAEGPVDPSIDAHDEAAGEPLCPPRSPRRPATQPHVSRPRFPQKRATHHPPDYRACGGPSARVGLASISRVRDRHFGHGCPSHPARLVAW